MSSRPPLYRTDLEKSVITSNLLKRGFTASLDPEIWDFFWAEKGSIKGIFHPDSGIRLSDNQIINHFPNHYELTRKDLLVKNFKRYRKDLEKEGNELAEKDETGNYVRLDIIPQTYLLPGDYSLFVDEFKKNPQSVWILKPNARSQGSGILIVSKLSQVKKWAAANMASLTPKESYLASRYIENPLLVGGKKFDLRLYVLITSYKPLKVYYCRNGFARFCNSEYSTNYDDLDNQYIHLTNVAIQKHGADYNENHGNKFHVLNLKLYMEAVFGSVATETLFDNIENLILQSLKAVQAVIQSNKHSFECLGYDVLIDSNLKPWLLEVNASPSLSTTTDADRILKTELLHDIFEIVFPPGYPNIKIPISQIGVGWNSKPQVGAFQLLYDELEDSAMTDQRKEKSLKLNLWK